MTASNSFLLGPPRDAYYTEETWPGANDQPPADVSSLRDDTDRNLSSHSGARDGAKAFHAI